MPQQEQSSDAHVSTNVNAIRNNKLDILNPALLNLLRHKLDIPGTGPVNVSADRVRQLEHQVSAQLRPVLREQEFEQFDLARTVATVRSIAHAVGGLNA